MYEQTKFQNNVSRLFICDFELVYLQGRFEIEVTSY